MSAMDSTETLVTTRPRTSIRPVSVLSITRDRPVLIQLDDDLLSSGPRNRMSITVWVGESDPEEMKSTIARSLAIGFLERALETMRASPAACFDTTPEWARATTRDVDAL